MYEYLQIGEIVNTHGIKGEVKVLPLTDDPGRFNVLKWAYLDRGGNLEKLKIQGVKHSKSAVILKFAGIDTVEAAEALKGSFLQVDRKNAVKLPDDSYFICDIIGSSVQDMSGAVLGTLEDVLQTGSNDVYVVRKDGGGQLLLPALKSVIREISVENGIIKVIIPEGLADDEV